MLTPQDISEKRFDKVLIGGYDMPTVDDFLEAISTDYNALYKENAILKGKLKVLVEKVEEYRSTEDAMRMALLTAQRMGEEITVEAARTKEEMLKSADEEVKSKLSDISKKIAAEEVRLAAASKETAKFLELSHAIMRKHSEFLKKLESANQVVSASSSSAPVRSAASEPAQPKPAAKPAAQPKSAPKPAAPAAAPKPAPEAPPPVMPTPAPAPAAAPAAPAEKVKTAPAVPALDFEFDDIAQEIGNAVEEMTADVSAPVSQSESEAPADNTPETLFEKSGDTIEIPATDEATLDVTPRPKFDFDDLKFGANFDNDD